MRLSALFRVTALALAISACAPAPAKVAQGLAVTTGNSAYDEFFAQVKELREIGLGAPAVEQRSHEGLANSLAVEAKAGNAAIIDATAGRAKKLLDAGVSMHLELTPEAKLVLAKGKADPGPNGEALIKAVEEAAKSSLEARKKLAVVGERAAALEKRRAELKSDAASAFKSEAAARREDVLRELDAAEAVIAAAGDAANRSAAASARFVVELAQAVETGAPPGGEPPPTKPTKGPKRWQPPAKGAVAAPAKPAPPKPGAAPAPAGPPKPAGVKKSKASDDFEP